MCIVLVVCCMVRNNSYLTAKQTSLSSYDPDVTGLIMSAMLHVKASYSLRLVACSMLGDEVIIVYPPTI